MLVPLLIAFGIGIAVDVIVTKVFKASGFGTVLGVLTFLVVAAVELGLW